MSLVVTLLRRMHCCDHEKGRLFEIVLKFNLSAFSMDTTSQLDVLRHDRLGVDRAQGHDGRALESQICLYISPETTKKQKKFFVVRNFFEYQKEIMPIIVTGNYNIDLSKEENIVYAEFMEKYLNLKLASEPTKATNLSG